jgi:peptidoglycan-N-acetylglucosamine deacetylase
MSSLLLIIAVFSFINYGIPWLYARGNKYFLRKFSGRNGEVYITFDDGPGSRLTPQLLELLAKHHAKATFFLLGKNIPGKEAFVEKIISHGHAIASHGYDHLHAWKKMPWQIISDIKKGNLVIDRVTDNDNRIFPFRPPHGKFNLMSLFYLWAKGIPICLWTIDSGDTWPDEKKSVLLAANRVLQDRGGVILFHDFDRATDDNDRYVLEAVQHVLVEGKKTEMVFSTFSGASPRFSLRSFLNS